MNKEWLTIMYSEAQSLIAWIKQYTSMKIVFFSFTCQIFGGTID